jgi:hypothetical protein
MNLVRHHEDASRRIQPMLSSQSQSFFQRYRSNLPTSLTRLILSTRGCEPRRPDAVSGTADWRLSSPSGFQRPVKTHQTPRRSEGLCQCFILISGQAVSKESHSQRAKITLSGVSPGQPEFENVTISPPISNGIKTILPFERTKQSFPLKTPSLLLGPTHPRTKAVHSEPLSTSAIEVLI